MSTQTQPRELGYSLRTVGEYLEGAKGSARAGALTPAYISLRMALGEYNRYIETCQPLDNDPSWNMFENLIRDGIIGLGDIMKSSQAGGTQ